MSIYSETRKSKSGSITSLRWVAEVTIRGRRIKGRFTTKQEAQSAEGRWLRGDLPEEGESVARPTTLLQALDLFAGDLWAKPQWRETCCYSVREWARHLGGNPTLAEINTARIDAAAAAFAKARGITRHSVRKYMCCLNVLLKQAAVRGLIPTAPHVPWPKAVEVGKRRELTLDEEVAFRAFLATKSPTNPLVGELLDYFTVCLDTAMRRGEVLSLSRDQVQGDTVTLWKTKSGRMRTVVVTPEVQAILEQRLPWKITVNTLRYWWRAAKAQAGLGSDRRLTPHSMRHAAATRLLEAETDIAIVRDYLGHERIATTAETYAHVTRRTKREAAQRLGLINSKARTQGSETL